MKKILSYFTACLKKKQKMCCNDEMTASSSLAQPDLELVISQLCTKWTVIGLHESSWVVSQEDEFIKNNWLLVVFCRLLSLQKS